MKYTSRLILFLFILLATTFLPVHSQTVTDYDGNVYETVTFGNQTWMAENLRTTHYSDGTPIGDGSEFDYYPFDVAMEGSDTTKYFFYYNNNESYADPYGCLYNWFAAVNGINSSDSNPSGIQGVCPEGWHIPSISEWVELENFVGENGFNDLMEGGSSGFNALLAGFRRDTENRFSDMGTKGAYISTTAEPDGFVTLFHLYSNQIYHWAHRKTTGYSVRCVQNSNITSSDIDIVEPAFKFYPNPCNDILYIDCADSDCESASLYSPDGRFILSKELNEGKNLIYVSEFSKGLYFLQISCNDYISVHKLIIR